MKRIKRIENTGVALGECLDHGTVLALLSPGPSMQEPILRKAHLYMVVMTLKRMSSTGHPLHPIHSTEYCIAEDEEGAISQVNCAFWPNLGYFPESERENFSAVATRIPLRIRGWGAQPF
jgi:hypothetical protein